MDDVMSGYYGDVGEDIKTVDYGSMLAQQKMWGFS
jgi:hypothetical protein